VRWLFCALAVFLLAFAPSLARAQGHVSVNAALDDDTIEVGQSVRMTLQAQSDAGDPHDAQPGATPGFQVRLVGEMPTHMSFNINGVQSERNGLSVTWQLKATKPGTYTIGPASVAVGRTRYAARPLKITVVPAGTLPASPRQPPAPFNPFKLFGQDDDDFLKAPEPQIEADPKLSLPAPRGPVAFLHATVDKPSAVLGEQVTFSVYLYIDASEREPEFTDVHEAPAADFVRKPLQDNEMQALPVGVAKIGSKIYGVKLLRRSALFPLKTGDLDIGAMTLTVSRTRSANGVRASEALRVHVADPPAAGRPPGFVPGTVGNMKLAAEVSPRETPAGGAISVTLDLEGLGNLPASLPLPVIPGVEWLEPQIHEKLGAQNGRYGGKRTFAYVVKLHRPGLVDLGDVTLPFYDPETGGYHVARATLGSIHVTPNAAAVDRSEPEAPKALADLPSIAKGLEGTGAPRAHLTDSRWIWLGMGAPPVAWLFAIGARAGARRARERIAARAASPQTELKRRMQSADEACANAETIGARAATAAIARALESAAIARLGVNLRGATSEALAVELAETGWEKQKIDELIALVRECEVVRFAPVEGDAREAKERWARARATIDAMPRGRP
jgi:hypothetical protein